MPTSAVGHDRAMPPLRVLVGLACLLGITACTEEGEGSATATDVGLFAIPWWAIGVVVVAWAGVVWLRKRRRR